VASDDTRERGTPQCAEMIRGRSPLDQKDYRTLLSATERIYEAA
jgi:hypothetical protein